MGYYNARIMAEFNPPKQWILGRDLSYTTKDLLAEEVKKSFTLKEGEFKEEN